MFEWFEWFEKCLKCLKGLKGRFALWHFVTLLLCYFLLPIRNTCSVAPIPAPKGKMFVGG
jgi:hypothetical protein